MSLLWRPTMLLVCARGHISGQMETLPARAPRIHCQRCGSRLMVRCRHCRTPIWGQAAGFALIDYRIPTFCVKCGRPFPWAGPDDMANHIENLLLEEQLPDGDRRALAAQLQVLREPPTTRDIERQYVQVFRRMRDIAPRAWGAAQPVITSIATAWIKHELGL